MSDVVCCNIISQGKIRAVAIFVTHTQTLATNTSVELISLPLIVEGGTVLKYSTAGTMTNGVDIAISYLNINKEVVT